MYGAEYQSRPSAAPESKIGRMWGCCSWAVNLQGDQPVEPEVVGQIDRGHPAPAEFALEAKAVVKGFS